MALKLYKMLCFLRFLLVFIPQTGYIHPDEHFQGPEVVYGDILDLKTLKTWDFAAEKPIRSIAFPYLITGPFSVLMATLGIKSFHGINLLPYFLLISPRVIMCFISFINDLFIYKICNLMKTPYNTSLLIFSSSYITLVYLTRTFSNCLEVNFFTVVTYLACKILYTKPNYRNTQSKINTSFMLGLLIAMGIFNRPTFICYALIPVHGFFLALLNCKNKLKLKLVFSFILGGASLTFSFICIDTFYYNQSNYHNQPYFYDNICITPLNFIIYNTNKTNLNVHGKHPHWLHVLVNTPLLFSIYGIFLLLTVPKTLFIFFKKLTLPPKDFLGLSFCVPLLLLSIIPHQEPRFLIPLIFPLCLLHYDQYFYAFIPSKVCIKIWYCHNILGLLFYGFLHQSGVFLSSAYIHSALQNNTNSVVLFYMTYMPPRYLLGLEKNQENINVYDFAGKSLNDLDSLINGVILQHQPKTVYVATVNEVADAILNLQIFKSKYKILEKQTMFPHLSTECLPNLNAIRRVVMDKSSLFSKLLDLKQRFSIHVLLFKVS